MRLRERPLPFRLVHLSQHYGDDISLSELQGQLICEGNRHGAVFTEVFHPLTVNGLRSTRPPLWTAAWTERVIFRAGRAVTRGALEVRMVGPAYVVITFPRFAG